ncbi:hypothetical protein BDW59DRAFT_149625 [Aspergillus cavernicola]|uniref:Uncharacterized protein n=1 Tax=Aspergillus cavernicola TaxID=176166 RepID=A0ABR4I3F0_9EURO
MPWSIDTSISFITLLLTGTLSLLGIWNHVANTYRRIAPQVNSSTEASIASGQQRQSNVDPEVLLESGLYTETHQTQPGSEPRLTRRTQSV